MCEVLRTGRSTAFLRNLRKVYVEEAEGAGSLGLVSLCPNGEQVKP